MKRKGSSKYTASSHGLTASTWQAVALAKVALSLLLVVSVLGLAFCLAHGLLLVSYSGDDPAVADSLVSFSLSRMFGERDPLVVAIPGLPGDLLIPFYEAAAAAACALLVLAFAVAFWRVYRYSFELREEPVEIGSKDERPWLGFLDDPCGAGAASGFGRVDEESLAVLMDEFFVNALVRPRQVFSRVSERVSPGRRMLDCTVTYELSVPDRYGMRIVGLNDLSARNAGEGEVAECRLLVPVSFQRRGRLALRQDVRNTSGILFPVVRHGEVVERIVGMVDRFGEGRFSDDDSAYWEASLKGEVEAYLNNMEKNPDISVPVKLGRLLAEYAESEQERDFCVGVTKVLVGLKDVVPTCVLLHAAALAGKPSRTESARTFSLTLDEKREMDVKPENLWPNPGRNPLKALANRILRGSERRGDTIYYNLARAGRSPSYHLYVEGPEGTYYARSSLLRQDVRDSRRITARRVEMQRRYGQRNAHIYVKSGHRMSNVSFMFVYRKAPLDTFHIMFIAVLMCTAVLCVCAMESLSSSSTGASVATMLLAVVTAAGPWIYGRAKDGRDEGWGIQSATIAMTLCSVCGLVLFFWMDARGASSGSGGGEAPGGSVGQVGFAVWCALLAVMLAFTFLVGFTALLHSSIYHYLLEKSSSSDGRDAPKVKVRRPGEVGEGDLRMDTPQGRFVQNPYALWTRALYEFRRECGVDEE